MRAGIHDGSGWTEDEIKNGPIVNDDQWHHVALVFDRDSHFTFYKDGEATVGVDISAKKESIGAGASGLGIGNSPDAAWTHWFPGTIDEAALFKLALTQDDIQFIMKRGITGAGAVDLSGKLATTWGSIKKQ